MRHVLLAASMMATVLCAGHARAADAKLKAGLMDARSTLVTMTKDPSKRDAAQQALVKSSADKFSAMLAATTPPAGKDAAFKELTELWTAFKQTREVELVPAILAGKDEAAAKIAGGVQKDRYEKMMAIIDAM